MRGYFFRIIAIAATCLAIHFCVCLYMPSLTAAGYWVREMIIVKRALADSSSSPRIVVLGGSSALFGIDARQVTAETGVFTMNMGLHAAMRMDRLLAVGEETARRGDIFVLALEHTFYDCAEVLWTDWQIRNMLTMPGPVCPAIAGTLSSFVVGLKTKGARVVVAHTPYLVDGAPAPGWQEAEEAFLHDLAAIGVEVVDHREELFFPRASFFNTNLHLNEDGRRERTKLLVRDLRRLGIGMVPGETPAKDSRPSPPIRVK
jgi:hypothetical protein